MGTGWREPAREAKQSMNGVTINHAARGSHPQISRCVEFAEIADRCLRPKAGARKRLVPRIVRKMMIPVIVDFVQNGKVSPMFRGHNLVELRISFQAPPLIFVGAGLLEESEHFQLFATSPTWFSDIRVRWPFKIRESVDRENHHHNDRSGYTQ